MPFIKDKLQHPNFSTQEIDQHIQMLSEKVFQVTTKWPHFQLLLDDLRQLNQRIQKNSLIISLERGLLYGGYSLVAPIFSGHKMVIADCSPQSADKRGAYNGGMIDDQRFLPIPFTHRTNIEHTGFEAEQADLLVVTNLVHHIANQEALFNEIFRLLKPNGIVYIFEPLVRELHQIPDDFIRYTPFGLENALRNKQLEIIQSRTEGGPFSAVAYCWAQALEYFPEKQRNDMSQWFYNEHFPELMSWDKIHLTNQIRQHTSFPMAFSVIAKKVSHA